MGIRMFQIIVPIIALLVILWQLRRIYLVKATWADIWPSIAISGIIGLIAIFPDTITDKLANILDFKSNINAILFVLIGVAFVFLVKLYDMYRKQQRSITKLTQELSILKAREMDTAP